MSFFIILSLFFRGFYLVFFFAPDRTEERWNFASCAVGFPTIEKEAKVFEEICETYIFGAFVVFSIDYKMLNSFVFGADVILKIWWSEN